MTYVRVDDHFTEHPKVLDVGPLAEALWLRGLLYASRNLTDGFVPVGFLRRMADMDALGQAQALVQAGLWHESDGGYRIHDYGEWQRSKEEVVAISQVRAEAGRKGGLQRASNQANPKHVASKPRSKPQAYTEDSHSQIQSRGEETVEGAQDAPAPKPKRAVQIPKTWYPTPNEHEWATAEGFTDEDIGRETAKFLDHFIATGKPMKDWGAAWKNWMRRSREWGPARASPSGAKPDGRGENPQRWFKAAERFGGQA